MDLGGIRGSKIGEKIESAPEKLVETTWI